MVDRKPEPLGLVVEAVVDVDDEGDAGEGLANLGRDSAAGIPSGDWQLRNASVRNDGPFHGSDAAER
ncbi:hypothetical protein [Mesorhizobium sp. M1E.F.Ca.ET.041.01.1.1]|uniref:hypothetical protein n=1 Tax=Mesorhizobium sp. M1E.F.Ca.ET.041.01.1.1 TaxID=2496759 RepID=UPI001678FD89|nr:hypothetical protein [Mesorhizobium sp. M1E.F.Ca.ET.041.01.1.1]